MHSEQGEGSTFRFYFPGVEVSSDLDAIKNNVLVPEDLEQFQKATVLVVDDVESNQNLIREYFEGSKHTLLMANDGLEGMRMAVEFHPDVILLDLRMPNMDGMEVARRLREKEETKEIPIIMLTASALQGDRSNILSLCSSLLYKPITRSQLAEQLKQFLPPEVTASIPEVSGDEYEYQARDKWPELLEKLLEEEKTLWPQLCQTMKMRDLQQFAEQLQQWASESGCPPLQDYARILATQIENFDWENLPQTMAIFPQVKERIKENLAKNQEK